MSRNNDRRRSSKNRNWNNNNNNNRNNQNNQRSQNDRVERDRRQQDMRRRALTPEQQKEIAENENAIREFKANVTVCEICGEPIQELSSAINNKNTGNPVHFDCVLNKITEEEKPGPNEKVTYIGNGKFAILYFENVHDMRHFTIRKTIEWESRESERGQWRDTMAGLYSQVK